MAASEGELHLLAAGADAPELEELEAPVPCAASRAAPRRRRVRALAAVALGSAGALALAAAARGGDASAGVARAGGARGGVPVAEGIVGFEEKGDEKGEEKGDEKGKEKGDEKDAKHESKHATHHAKKAATPCGMAAAGSTCYSNVVWAMTDGIKTHPDWYPGLTQKSLFEDFQRHLSKEEENNCAVPCEKPGCETAAPGSTCFDNVQWIMTTGISQHAEWFQGLTVDSPMEDVQDHVHKSNKTACPKIACNPQPFKPVTLFCWMVVRQEGYEFGLVKAQLEKKAGVFACDDYVLISNKPLDFQGVKVLQISSTSASGWTGDGTSPNAPIFVEAWEKIKEDGRYLAHDWVVKCDPDTVLIPARLKEKLMPGHQPENPYPPPFKAAPGAGQWVTNCDKMASWGKGWGDGWPMMYGAVEIISREAMIKYYANVDNCKMSFPWQGMGEDAFMGMCLRKLEVGELFMKQGDGNCAGGACTDASFQAYHPRKDINSWMECWGQATR